MHQLLKLLCAGFICAIQSIFAQTTGHTSKFPKPGTRSLFYSLDSSCYIPGSSGASQTWDFTGFRLLDTTALYYLDPGMTPYHYQFPSSNLAMSADNINFDYFLFTDSGYYDLGSIGYDPESGRAMRSVFSEPEPMLKLPATFESHFHASSNRLSENIGWYNVHSKIESNHLTDAHGTLYLPCDTIYNAFRKLENVHFTDSITNGIRYMIAQQWVEKYQWFDQGIGAPVLSLNKKTSILKGDTSITYTGTVSCREKQPAHTSKPFPVYISSIPYSSSMRLHFANLEKGTIKLKYSVIDNKQKTTRKLSKDKYNLKAGPAEMTLPEFTFKDGMAHHLVKIQISGSADAELYVLLFNPQLSH